MTFLKKTLSFCIAAMMFHGAVCALNRNKLDSLNKELKVCKIDTQKTNILIALAGEYIIDSPDSAIVFGNKALELSQKINFGLGVAKSYRRIGAAYKNKSDLNRAIEYYNKALKINTQIGRNDRVAQEYINIGGCYLEQKSFRQTFKYYNTALKIYERNKDKFNIALTCKEIGVAYYVERNRIRALEYFNYAIKLCKEIGDKILMEKVYSIIANMFHTQNNYVKALEYQLKALQIAETSDNLNSKIESYFLVADIYNDIENYVKAIEYKSKALKILEKRSEDMMVRANCYFYIGKNYVKLKDYKKALEFCEKSLETSKSIKNEQGVGASYAVIAEAYVGMSEYALAMENIKKGINLFEKLVKTNHDYYMALNENYIILIDLYNKKKEFQKALKYIDLSLKINKEHETGNELIEEYESIAATYEGLKEYKKALEYYRKSQSLHDSIFSKEDKKKLEDLQSNFDIEKKEIELTVKAKAAEERIKLIAKGELKQQRMQRNSFIGGFALMMLLAGVSYRNFRRKKKDNLVITLQKQLVETKNKEITDSIEYALRIQTAILPPQKIVKQYLENSFILYKPKDIVAGDFYWMETVRLANEPISELADENNQLINTSANQLILFAACDCTGHGVPGAMVSVVCHNALNRAVREFGLTQPAAILDKTAEIVIENFAKSEEDIKDGMDISLCSLNFNKVQNFAKVELQWAGANNALWLIQNGELIETKADKQPIGMYEDNHPFTNHEFKLNTGDSIYIFSDGFADQFSPDDKKLMRKKFKEILLSIQHLSITEQKDHLDHFIENWKGSMEQTDDILVMGLRV